MQPAQDCSLTGVEGRVTTTLEAFQALFKFDPARAFYVGIERESFVIREKEIVPFAHEVLTHVRENGWRTGFFSGRKEAGDLIGYELSACQIETRTTPCKVGSILTSLKEPDFGLRSAMKEIGLWPLFTEVAPDTIPLDVYPDPTGRYQKITANMPREVLLAACQVAGTHVHIGLPDHDVALRVYNVATRHWQRLSRMGDYSHGRRLRIYSKVAKDRTPRPYRDWNAYLEAAQRDGFDQNPRNCWTLIRLSTHGTIEFRMFGTTPRLDRIVRWARECHRICSRAAR